MGFKSACGAFLSPLRWSAERRTTTPVPSSKEGDYGGRNEIFSNLWLARCKATDPWLWLAGLAVCRKREGVPIPRSGGGREGADASAIPYKHRLAHDPGRRSRSGRAFRCVGFLGRSPKPFLHPFVGTKGCPRRVGVQIRLSQRLAPPKATANQPPPGRRTDYRIERILPAARRLQTIPRRAGTYFRFISAASHTRPPAARPTPG